MGAWNDKAAGFVSYGVHGGVRAVEQLRQIAAEVKLADVGEVVTWAEALAPVRTCAPVNA